MKLEVRDLSFGYPGKAVGRGVSFDLNPGEVVALLGPNGGGKTTLFKTILGLLKSQGGDAFLDGNSIRSMKRREIARGIGFVPQAYAGYFPFTVMDTVLMGRTAHIGMFASPSRSDRVVAEEMIEFMGIWDIREQPYTHISGGQRQLALIARALAQETKIMVMDEPTASLDFGNQVRVLDCITTLASRGIGVILSTHDPDHAFLCGNRVVILKDGRVAHIGTPEEVITSEMLRHVYGVDIEVRALETMRNGRQIHVCIPLEVEQHSVGSRTH
ncbi:MAG: ABC transporter ATP-binding protein [Rhodospirillaceae bacterium]|nr:ABC transporter ATP-binding protein [Rhodospirillaceae bacterium]